MNVSTLLSPLRITASILPMLLVLGCGEDPISRQEQLKQDSIAQARRLDSIALASQTDELRSGVLCDLVQNVILPVIDEFHAQTGTLNSTIRQLSQQPNEANLEAARRAWRDTRGPWETCEAFLFGPAKTQQLDPAIDSWPIDLITIDSMLISKDLFTAEYFDRSEGSVKGSHAIELLLWGENGAKRVGEITPRELEFLAAASESMLGAAERLKRAWIPPSASGARGYGEEICNAGKPGYLYSTRAGAVREFLNSLISIITEVSEGKMGIPYQQGSIDFEEARFSGNSKEDFLANLRGVRSIYTGTYGSRSGRGIGDLVRAADSSLDARITASIADAFARVEAIQPTFGEAVLHDRKLVLGARQSLLQLATQLSDEVSIRILPAR